MGLLVFLKIDIFCPVVRSMVVDASSCPLCSLRYVVSVAAMLKLVLTAVYRLYMAVNVMHFCLRSAQTTFC